MRRAILIRLGNNEVYTKLMTYALQIKQNIERLMGDDTIQDKTKYTQFQRYNRALYSLVQVFFFAHLYFLKLFLQATEDDMTTGIFNSILLNGGKSKVTKIFEFLVDQFDLCHTDNILETREKLEEMRKILCTELSYDVPGHSIVYYPWFAIDECHCPLSDMVGVIFHGDYKTHCEKYGIGEILDTYRYETQQVKDKPENYNYKGKTSMFGLFRAVLDKYLFSERVQLTIFSSTVFKVWRNYLLNEPSLYSRDRPVMNHFTTLFRFTDDHVDIIKDLKLRGRPGWYFEYYLKGDDYLEKCTRRLKQIIDENTENKRFNTMMKRIAYCLYYTNSTTVKVQVKSKDSLYLNFGILENWEDSIASISIDEEIVVDYLKSLATTNQMTDILTQEVDTTWEAVEHAIAAGLRKQDTILSLLQNWDVYDTLTDDSWDYFDGYDIAGFGCTFHDRKRTYLWLDSLTDKEKIETAMIFPVTTCGPDLIVIAKNDSNLCLISVQVKTYLDSKMDDLDFIHAISTTSTFFSSQGKYETAHLRTKIKWLRIVVITSGYTSPQIALVKNHNKKHPNEPIILVAPREDEHWEMLFGQYNLELKNKGYSFMKNNKNDKTLKRTLTLDWFDQNYTTKPKKYMEWE